MVADAQSWLDDPQSNFGWVLMCDSETSDFTARGFASHEDVDQPPQLLIEYMIQPRIEDFQRHGGEFYFLFTAEPGQAYTVEFSENVGSGNWQTLGYIDPQQERTEVLVIDRIKAPSRFYRVAVE